LRKASLLMLTSLILIVAGMLAPTPVKAQTTTLEIPQQTVPNKGMKFNVTIWVWNVTNLWAFGLTLVWNASVCNYTGTWGVSPPADRIWAGDVFAGKAASAIMIEKINASCILGIGQTLLTGTPSTGTFSLVKIEFYAKDYGVAGLNFSDRQTRTGMMNSTAQDIPHVRLPYPITVVPEFPAYLFMPLFLTATIIAAVLAKTVWSKRLRGRFDVK